MEQNPYVYTIAGAAKMLSVSRITISRWISSGKLPASRLGHRTVRIKHEDVVALLKAKETM